MPADNCGHFLIIQDVAINSISPYGEHPIGAGKKAAADGKLLSEVFMFLAFLLACGSLIGLIMFFGGGLF